VIVLLQLIYLLFREKCPLFSNKSSLCIAWCCWSCWCCRRSWDWASTWLWLQGILMTGLLFLLREYCLGGGWEVTWCLVLTKPWNERFSIKVKWIWVKCRRRREIHFRTQMSSDFNSVKIMKLETCEPCSGFTQENGSKTGCESCAHPFQQTRQFVTERRTQALQVKILFSLFA